MATCLHCLQAEKKSRRVEKVGAQTAAHSPSASDMSSDVDESDKENERQQHSDMPRHISQEKEQNVMMPAVSRVPIPGSILPIYQPIPKDDESVQLPHNVEEQIEAERKGGGRKLTRIMKRAVVTADAVPNYMEGLEEE